MVDVPEIFDSDIFTGTGFYEGSRGCFTGRVAYLLGHAILMDKEKEAAEKVQGYDDLDDYVDQKFKAVQLADNHQVIGGRKRRGKGAFPMIATAGGGSIGTFMFNPQRAMVPYGSEAAGSRRHKMFMR